MKLIKADHDRRIEIAGVPGPVRRPVDIDQSQTGFANLRTLRIYRFESGSTINGHAEEDEVFVIVLAGSIELTVTGDDSGDNLGPISLRDPGNSQDAPCVAYLPPLSAYRLIAKTGADVAYARATPAGSRPSAVFSSQSPGLNQNPYALRLRVTFTPITETQAAMEALVHVRTEPAGQSATITNADDEPRKLDSWDTVAIAPGDRPVLRIAEGTLALVLTVLAV